MAAHIAIAPAPLRVLAPGQPSSHPIIHSRSGVNGQPLSTTSIHSSKVFSASPSRPRSIALAPSNTRVTNLPNTAIKPRPSTSTAGVRVQNSSDPPEREGSFASTSETSATTESSLPSAGLMHKVGHIEQDGVVQPRKEWVLPARAKPGRKPSDVEPPTKRKAQNRASQRAFRERKQSYVASLEEKIEEYERQQVEFSSELQKVARGLKDENESLRSENTKLRKKVHLLQEQLSNKEKETASSVAMSRASSQASLRSDATKTTLDTTSFVLNDTTGSGVWNWSVESEGRNSAGLDRDCGFCTEQSLCVCRGEAVLDLGQGEDRDCSLSTPVPVLKQEGTIDRAIPKKAATSLLAPALARPSKPSTSKLWYTVPSMGPPPVPPVHICPTDSRSRHPFRLGSSSNVLPPLQNTAQGKPTLWPVYSPIQRSIDSQSQQDRDVPIYRLTRSTSAIDAACSGDPAHCNACSTDPALAAFCRAVASHLVPSGNGYGMGRVTPAILDVGNAMPLRNRRKRNYDDALLNQSSLPSSSTTTRLYTNSSVNDDRLGHLSTSPSYPQPDLKQSIPKAWQRIKQHPSFPTWQGGLDLLADVVSKRSDAREEEAIITPRVDILAKSSVAMKFHRKSNDRSVDQIHPPGKDNGEEDEDRNGKRRRLYVNKESVDDALALLDQGLMSSSSTSKAKEDNHSQSCVCPLNRSL